MSWEASAPETSGEKPSLAILDVKGSGVAGVYGHRPTVSVGLPVYNGETYLAAAIQSLLSQTFEDFELVISDNGSTDGTEEICRSFALQDPRVRYLRAHQNHGLVWNFNEVFRQTCGTFFKPAAHDDLHEPTFLERCVGAFRDAPPSVVLVHPKTQLIDLNGAPLQGYEDGLDLRDAEPHLRLRQYLRNVRMVNPYFGLHKRSVYQTTRLMQGFVSADKILLAELALRGQFWEIPERLFLRRDHPGRSELAHSSYQELVRFYDPSLTGESSGRYTRLVFEAMRAVARAPLSLAERRRCAVVVMQEWGRRYARRMVGEVRESRFAFHR